MSVTEESKTMMLAKNFTPKKLTFPVFMSEKLDGVPGNFSADGVLSRQMKPLLGVTHIADALADVLPPGLHIVGENHVPGKRFKYTSGKVRKGEICREAKLGVFDIYEEEDGKILPHTLEGRLERVKSFLGEHEAHLSRCLMPGTVFPIEHTLVHDFIEATEYMDRLKLLRKERYVEGAIIQPCHSLYKIARSWDFQRIVFKPMVDLEVVGVEEAISIEGEPKGMIGAFYVRWRDKQIKVAAGRSNHGERTEWFENPEKVVGRIIQVQYKDDDSYDVLREPVFICFRDDKDVADSGYADASANANANA